MDHDVDRKKRDIPLNLTLTLAALVVIIGGMKLGADLLVPLLLSLFIAVICTAPVHWLYRLGVSRRLSVLLTLVILGLFLTLLGTLLASSFATFMEALPQLEDELRKHYLSLLNWLSNMGVHVQPRRMSEWLDPTTATQMVPTFLGGIGNLLSQSVLIMLLVIFMLFETLDFREKVAQSLDNPAPSLRRFKEFSHNLKRYLAIKTVISLITGTLIYLACLLLGVQFPLLWGTLAFSLNYIPNIGSALAAVPAVLLTLVMPDGGLAKASVLALAYLLVNFVIGNLIEPRVMGHTLGLSTLVAFLSLVVWGWILGPVGMLLAVPLTMTLKIALNSHPETRWLARMLGGRGEY
ncbi:MULTISPECIES: AI-2E family transporter [unclassified Modicisalibacter]|uniref:AI-2E family transporter n=1 Tax=unclassified Modicisalibacter TaxID=2679913 RepID=UPI001CCBF92A|nr:MULTISPECIES: AI-2E family transporter [unclassified Modicisalibacter]MBZ9560426.1 AI-2E family transporter [Modicisalibacter sp. R2A 31.J]MBZ9576335.1 AI-2E family transporter [Modicisalibacter sp. MOD 31.J]